ncbi:B12-binding domain-containing radical SAM protein [Fusibacter sp. JL298sf-3]
MNYTAPVYRPPSEAKSLIVQVTTGCAHNTCTFCSMYKGKPFKIVPVDDILSQLEAICDTHRHVKRIFLADGDALVLKTEHLLTILNFIKAHFPNVERVSCYATPKDILNKSDEALKTLYAHGLTMVYMGVETGSDTLLKRIKKGVTSEEMIEAGQKIRRAGFTLSVTVISGLGGCTHRTAHAVETARVISAIEPEYLGLLTLMVEPGTPLYKDVQAGVFTVPDVDELLEETYQLVEAIETHHTVFRANHASNFIAFSGVLPQEKTAILEDIDGLRRDPEFLALVKETKLRSL